MQVICSRHDVKDLLQVAHSLLTDEQPALGHRGHHAPIDPMLVRSVGSTNLSYTDNTIAAEAPAGSSIEGTSGTDTLVGSAGDDVIFAGDGNDTASGADGNERSVRRRRQRPAERRGGR